MRMAMAGTALFQRVTIRSFFGTSKFSANPSSLRLLPAVRPIRRVGFPTGDRRLSRHTRKLSNYITYYNVEHRHSSLDYLTPTEFETQHASRK